MLSTFFGDGDPPPWRLFFLFFLFCWDFFRWLHRLASLCFKIGASVKQDIPKRLLVEGCLAEMFGAM